MAACVGDASRDATSVCKQAGGHQPAAAAQPAEGRRLRLPGAQSSLPWLSFKRGEGCRGTGEALRAAHVDGDEGTWQGFAHPRKRCASRSLSPQPDSSKWWRPQQCARLRLSVRPPPSGGAVWSASRPCSSRVRWCQCARAWLVGRCCVLCARPSWRSLDAACRASQTPLWG